MSAKTKSASAATVTMTAETYDAVTLRLEQVGAMIHTLGIQIRETEEIPVSSDLLATSLSGFSTFICDIREMMVTAQEGGGAA